MVRWWPGALLLLLFCGCQLSREDIRDLPEPPTLEVPVVYEASLDEHWVALKPINGLDTYVGSEMTFRISSALRDTTSPQVSGGDGMDVRRLSPDTYAVSSAEAGRGFIDLKYDSIKTFRYPVMVRPTPNPIVVLGDFGNQGTIIRANLELPVWLALRPMDRLPDDHCSILSFVMKTVAPDGSRQEITIRGNGRRDDLYEKIKAHGKGDLLIFDAIRAQCKADVRPRILNPMVFTIQ